MLLPSGKAEVVKVAVAVPAVPETKFTVSGTRRRR